jgi:hypothetical protein
MKYVVLIYEPPEKLAARESKEYVGAWRAYHAAIVAAGKVHLAGAPLQDGATAATIRVRDGRRHVQDGPYADSKELIGGFMLLDLPSIDAALEWAARSPAASYGAVEVRPVDTEFHEIVAG